MSINNHAESSSSMVGGALVTNLRLPCGCVESRQSLPGHDDAVSVTPCDGHGVQA